MTETTTPLLDKIRSLLAEKGYDVSETSENVLKIREVNSGVSVQAVLEGDILFLSLPCITVEPASVTGEVMRRMLAADNGISTSYFQLYETGSKLTVTLNNFCKLQDMAADDEDDVLSCVHFLLADVISARQLIGGLLS